MDSSRFCVEAKQVMADEAMAEEVTPEQLQRAKAAELFLNKHPKGSLTPESRLIFVYRRGRKDSELPHKTMKLLHSLGMWSPYRGVFVKADEPMMIILQKLEPFVTYGYPPRQTVKDMICKSGAVKVNDIP